MKITFSKKEIRVDPKDVGLNITVKEDLFLEIEKGLYVGRDGIGTYESCLLFSKQKSGSGGI